MKLLVIGGGGREHAIIWKLKQNPKITQVYCAPGNAGISQLAECVHISATDISGLLKFAIDEKIDFTIVGMDDPLVIGIVDEFEKNGLKIFGPRKNAAIIEGSKAFSKELMKKYNIPTAEYEIFDNYNEAFQYLKRIKYPVVIKADGLALGKGVLICDSELQAETALKEIMIDKKFGTAGNKVVIEEYLTGAEVSILAFCDSKTIVPMVSAQDHKRALDYDQGLNTGGMGTFSPSKFYTENIADECIKKIFIPTMNALNMEGRPFKGIIFFGLMLTENGAKVIEYNCRFGDPETQVVLPRLKTDLLEILLACESETLSNVDIQWENNSACCVILASGGYPQKYETGYEIRGFEAFYNREDVVLFHAGTKVVDGNVVTSGGRVLGVTGIGSNLEDAIKVAYENVDKVRFKNMHFRTDIGRK